MKFFLSIFILFSTSSTFAAGKKKVTFRSKTPKHQAKYVCKDKNGNICNESLGSKQIGTPCRCPEGYTGKWAWDPDRK